MTYLRIFQSAALASCVALVAPVAQAQQISKPYSFKQQNRAQLAIAMRQMEGGGAGGAGGGGGQQFVCGGGSASATANSTCIIMNNSDGIVTTDQISDGDQSATNTKEATVNGETASDADEVLSKLME